LKLGLEGSPIDLAGLVKLLVNDEDIIPCFTSI
jgi:hypothetical protein